MVLTSSARRRSSGKLLISMVVRCLFIAWLSASNQQICKEVSEKVRVAAILRHAKDEKSSGYKAKTLKLLTLI